MIVPSRTVAKALALGKYREIECSRHKRVIIPIRRLIWSKFALFPGCDNILVVTFFAQLCQLYLTGKLVETQDSLWHPVFSCSFRKRYQELYFFWFQLGENLVVQRSTRPCRTELITPVRHCSVNTELNELFGTRVLCS